MNHHYASLRVQTQKTMRWLWSVVLLTMLTSGCVFFVPVPTAYHPPGSRRNLTEDAASRFAPRTATLDDVVLALGEPDEANADASWLTYRWERVNMHLVWGWVIPAADASIGQGWERTYSHALAMNFVFDECGVLQNVRTTNVDVRITESSE